MPPACAHCGLPLRGARISLDDGKTKLRFCCQGCKVAYQALAGSGLDRTFIIDREVTAEPSSQGKGEGGKEHWEFGLEGMVCEACAPIVRKVLEKTGGVDGARVNFITGRAAVDFDPSVIPRERIERRLSRFGYRVIETGEDARKARDAAALIRVSLGIFLAVDVMMLSLPEYLGAFAPGEMDVERVLRIAMALLCLPILGWSALMVFQRAWVSLMAWSPDIHFMAALGAASAYLYSLYSLYTSGPHVYFETAAFLPVLIVTGKAIEERARVKAREALTGLIDELPQTARLEGEGGEREVPPETLAPGDVVKLAAGSRAPCDGKVLSGEVLMDESLVSGESRPRVRGEGETVRAGVLCIGGEAMVLVTSALEDSMLAGVVSSLERAVIFRGPRQLVLDKIVKWMAPGIIVLALAALGAGMIAGIGAEESLLRAMAVTLFACPCALGLAAPLARAVAIGRAAKAGVVVRDGEALESAGRPDVIVFDKTGTLTRGEPALIETATAPENDGDAGRMNAIAAALEEGSAHPLARAFKEEGSRAENVSALPGLGVSGTVDGREWILGSIKLMRERGLELPPWAQAPEARLLAGGASVSFLAEAQGEVRAVFGFADEARPGAGEILRLLSGAGVKLAMFTGDNQEAASKVAGELGIIDVRSGLTPEMKRDLLLAVRREGRRVWFVGDGVNDAPALSVADLGIALGGGARIAAEAGALTISGEQLALIPDIIELSGGLARTVRWNLGWAAVYNVAGLPLAFLGLLAPAFSALAMMASSLSVTLNSSRLNARGLGR